MGDDRILEGALIGVAALHGLREVRIDEAGLRPVEKAPERVFAVVGDEFGQGAAEVAAELAGIKRLVAALEAVRMLFDIVVEGGLGRAAIVRHPEESDDGLVEGLDLLGEGGAALLPLLPVAAGHALDILRRGIIKIDRQTPGGGFGLDFREDFRLFLGAVGVRGFAVLLPQIGQVVAVGVLGLGGKERTAHDGGRQKKALGHFHRRNRLTASETTNVEPPI